MNYQKWCPINELNKNFNNLIFLTMYLKYNNSLHNNSAFFFSNKMAVQQNCIKWLYYIP